MAATVLILFLMNFLLHVWGDPSIRLPSVGKSEPQKPLCTGFDRVIKRLPYSGTGTLSRCRTRLEADGSVRVYSMIKVPQDKWNKGQEFTCQVTDLQTVQKDTSVCAEKSPPTIHLVEFGQSIMCIIEDFCPKTLSFKWKKDDREVRGRDWKTTENDSGSYRAVSVLEANLTSSSPGTKYTCEAVHEGKTYTKDLSPGAQFSLKIYPPQAKDLFIHKKAVIECVITGDSRNEVEGATVSWTVGGNPATRGVRDGGVKQAGPAFTKTSTLTLEESVWFSGTEVICSTSRDQRTTSDRISVKKGGKRPSIIIYKPHMSVSDSDMGSLVCVVSSSDLGDVFIMWQVNNGQYTEGNGMATIVKKDNTVTVLSYLTVPGKDYNSAKFTCAVKDANMQNDIEPRRNTTSISKDNCPPLPVPDRR